MSGRDMDTVTKQKLAAMLEEHLNCTKTQAKHYVEIFFEALSEAIAEGHRVEIRGFGAWTVKDTKARPQARNPKTGERVSVPAGRAVKFKPGQALREALKSNPSLFDRRDATAI